MKMKTNWQDCMSSSAQTGFTIFYNMFSKLHNLFPIEQYRMNCKNRHSWVTTAIKNPLIKKIFSLRLLSIIIVFKILKTIKLRKIRSHLSIAMLKESIMRENLS